MKLNRNFRAFTDFKLLELEVPTICLVIGGVSARRERRYSTCGMLEESKVSDDATFSTFNSKFRDPSMCLDYQPKEKQRDSSYPTNGFSTNNSLSLAKSCTLPFPVYHLI